MKLTKATFKTQVMFPVRGTGSGITEKQHGTPDATIEYDEQTGFVEVRIKGSDPVLIPRENISALFPAPQPAKK